MEAARPATAADLPRLAELARAGLAELRPTRGGEVFVMREARAEPVEETLAADLARADACLLAGTIDGHAVGYSAAHLEVLRDGGRLGIVDDLYVESGAREVGVGEAMMEALLGWFRSRGCHGVDATALPGNRGTKNFFESNGFSARLIVMHHRLDPSPPSDA